MDRFPLGRQTPRAIAAAAWLVLACLAPPPARAQDTVRAEPRRRATEGGFRMEGAAEVGVVFGDAERYQAAIDRFFQLEEAMATTRSGFSVQVHAALAMLAAEPRRLCPVAAVAPFYARAGRDGEQFRTLGSELENLYQSIRRLDALGETASLTPDYRWRVNRVRAVYRDALADYREMRLSFLDQLDREIRYRGCDPGRLVAAAGPGDSEVDPPASLAVNPPTRARKRRGDPPPSSIEASPAIFFIDNRSCSQPLRISLDGVEVGVVAAGAKEPFRALAGRHSMCLLPTDSPATCGQPGTRRTAYVHDGWSISLHCFEPRGGARD